MTNVCRSYRHLRQIVNSYAQQVRHFHAYAKIKNKFLPISIYLCLTIGVNPKRTLRTVDSRKKIATKWHCVSVLYIL
jgi:hypothetical protein